jgi:hypothetical protein
LFVKLNVLFRISAVKTLSAGMFEVAWAIGLKLWTPSWLPHQFGKQVKPKRNRGGLKRIYCRNRFKYYFYCFVFIDDL